MSSFFPGCEGAAVGVESIRCLNEAASFMLGWGMIAVLAFILWYNLENETVKDKVAVISFVLSIASMLFIAAGFLPADSFIYFFIVSLGSAAALMFRR